MAGWQQETGKWVFALTVGLVAAWFAYQWATNPVPRAERQQEEAAVLAARQHLLATADLESPTIVDALAPDRKVGKAYVYPSTAGWQVSGYYRRDEQDLWHPYLVELDARLALRRLKLSDSSLLDRDGEGGVLEVLP